MHPHYPAILEAEKRLRQAVLTHDVALLDDLIADDLLFVGPDGQLATKAMDLEAHRSGLLSVLKFEVKDQQFRFIGEIVVTVTLVALVGTFGGAAFEGDYRYTRVWQLVGSRWQIAAGQCAPVVGTPVVGAAS